MWVRRCVSFASLLAVILGLTGRADALEARGAVEVGLFVPYVWYDTRAPIQDRRGENDDIRNSFGRGVGGGYNFPHDHAAEFALYWVSTDSEDMHGRNFFAIDTRYFTLGYRKNWHWKGDIDPFFTAGVGDFYANAKEVDHESFGGHATYAGIGFRYSPDSRSSIRVYAQEMFVRLEPNNSHNLQVSVGGFFYFGGTAVKGGH